ncbi:hypothetical protein GGD81_000158 [Rhodobium orientis]|uniref:Ion transport domain-containing protein n=1 Tax=Rhodobium orientis TaxID=34017 RepID=A0A327JX61_9HYPH|nr:ion transporter [Rhodobium orientis]MBB4301143.1 hypothetical protein [Rhodobium orientis]MBK5949807.1 hypothetical protein [Rhodobium orientis]RAI30083.1 hypothetical protein CH339_00700 [Rhodobium orientis]
MLRFFDRALNAQGSREYVVFNYILLVLIFLSIFLLVVEVRYKDDIGPQMAVVVDVADYVIVIVFAVEYVLRVALAEKPKKYVFSFYGIVDFLAVFPSLLIFAFGGVVSVGFFRVLRLFRLFRILKIVRFRREQDPFWKGVLAQTAPYMAIGMALKIVVFAFEDQRWVPEIGNLGTVIAVVGFSIGVLLGSKLGVAQTRLHKFEDSLIETIGLLESIQTTVDRSLIREWTAQLETYFRTGENPDGFWDVHDRLILKMQEANIGAPIRASINQKVSYIVFRMKTETPRIYDEFLQRILIFYALAVIISIPGFFGFLSIILICYVLGGMYFVICDIDQPISHSRTAQIDADISPLLDYMKRLGVEPGLSA